MRYLTLLVLLLLSVNSWCKDSKFYAGGELASATLSDDGMTDFQSMSDHEGALGMFGGYQFSPYLAAEVALSGIGSYESETSFSDIYNDYSSFTVSALGKLPLGQGFAVYGQLGVGLVSIYQDITYLSGSTLTYGDHSDTDFATLLGGGVSYTLPMMKELELRAGVQQLNFTINAYSIDNASNLVRKNYDQDIREFYLGAAYHFN